MRAIIGRNRGDEELFETNRGRVCERRSTPDLRTAEGFLQIVKRYADAGITVWNIGNSDVHNMPEVTLNLPGRDQKIEEYKQYLRNLAKAGIHYTTYAHMGNGIWSSGRADGPRRVGPQVRPGEPGQEGQLGRQDLDRAALPRPRIHEGRDLGQLHLLHQAGRPRRRGGRRADRHPSRRPAGPRARRRPAVHLQQLRGLQAGPGDRRTAPTSGICLCCGTWLEGGSSSPARIPRR